MGAQLRLFPWAASFKCRRGQKIRARWIAVHMQPHVGVTRTDSPSADWLPVESHLASVALAMDQVCAGERKNEMGGSRTEFQERSSKLFGCEVRIGIVKTCQVQGKVF